MLPKHLEKRKRILIIRGMLAKSKNGQTSFRNIPSLKHGFYSVSDLPHDRTGQMEKDSSTPEIRKLYPQSLAHLVIN